MLLSHSKKFIYIHVYKVAGTSIRAVLQEFDDRTQSDFPWHQNLKFAIGKNIKFLSTLAIEHIKASEVKHYLPPDIFDTYFKFAFVRNPWDWQVSLYHFMLQYKDHPQHRIIAKMKNFDEYIDWRVNCDMELQKDFLYDKNENKLVDFIGKFENLQKDFDEICTKISIKNTKLPYINISDHKPYKEYYNSRTRDLVSNAFKKDIELFNYTF